MSTVSMAMSTICRPLPYPCPNILAKFGQNSKLSSQRFSTPLEAVSPSPMVRSLILSKSVRTAGAITNTSSSLRHDSKKSMSSVCSSHTSRSRWASSAAPTALENSCPQCLCSCILEVIALRKAVCEELSYTQAEPAAETPETQQHCQWKFKFVQVGKL